MDVRRGPARTPGRLGRCRCACRRACRLDRSGARRGRAGQAVAALATAASGAAMAVGHLLSTTTFDVLFWVTLVYLVTRILGGGDERQWLLVGVVAGVALENKQPVLLLVAVVFVWLPARAPLGSGRGAPGCGLVPALAFVCGYRTSSGRPATAGRSSSSPARSRRMRREGTGPEAPSAAAPAGRASPERRFGSRVSGGCSADPGLGRSVRSASRTSFCLRSRWSREQSPTTRWACLLALLGAGGVVAESWLEGRRGRKLALGGALLHSAAVAALITLPLVPVLRRHATPIPTSTRTHRNDRWPTFAATVSRVWNEMPQSERSTAVVYTSNYGEAGAIARYGPAVGIPRAYSGHNAFWRFGRPPNGARPIIVVGYHHPQALRGKFSGCVRSARIDNGVDSTTRNKAHRSGHAPRPSAHGQRSGHGCARSTPDRHALEQRPRTETQRRLAVQPGHTTHRRAAPNPASGRSRGGTARLPPACRGSAGARQTPATVARDRTLASASVPE